MKLQDIIRSKKEIIIALFCKLYGREYYERFSLLFDRVTFLFPNLYEEDRKQYFYELGERKDNLDSIPKSILLDYLERPEHFGGFIPMMRKKQEGIYQVSYFISLDFKQECLMGQNLDVILLHELKHLFTCNISVESNVVMTKAGLNWVEEIYEQCNKNSNEFYHNIAEVFTQLDAEYLAHLLHQTTEIFPRQQQVPVSRTWYQEYFPFITNLSSKDQFLLHQIELDSDYSKIELLSDSNLIHKLEMETYQPFPKRKQKEKQLNYFDKNRKK